MYRGQELPAALMGHARRTARLQQHTQNVLTVVTRGGGTHTINYMVQMLPTQTPNS